MFSSQRANVQMNLKINSLFFLTCYAAVKIGWFGFATCSDSHGDFAFRHMLRDDLPRMRSFVNYFYMYSLNSCDVDGVKTQ